MKRLPAACAVLAIVAGCATRPAPDFRGRWKPVNHYAETPQAIPLRRSYVYHASPMDGTLKTMLTRWARDAGMTLSYLHPSDFTLYGPVARIRTPDLEQAVSLLNGAYAGQQVLVAVEGGRIVVRAASDARAGRGAGAEASATRGPAVRATLGTP